jgi:hypothetical protein
MATANLGTMAARSARRLKRYWTVWSPLMSLFGPSNLSHRYRNLICPASQGFWKNHPSAWPTTLTWQPELTQSELLAILGAPVQGDACPVLARQLIAAKFNVLNFAAPPPATGRRNLSVHAHRTVSELSQAEKRRIYRVGPGPEIYSETPTPAAMEGCDLYYRHAVLAGDWPDGGGAVRQTGSGERRGPDGSCTGRERPDRWGPTRYKPR